MIGGGAAGFFCAVNAARLNPALEVIILEKSNKLLSKVKISGGGRCNVTHGCFEITEMIKRYPRGAHFVKKAFHQFFTSDTIQWFEDRQVKLKAEPDGRMFPVSNSSQTIVDCLLNEAGKLGVTIQLNAEVQSINPQGMPSPGEAFPEESNPGVIKTHSLTAKPRQFMLDVRTTGTLAGHNQRWAADFVCVACGGYPKTAMFDWLIRTGHTIEPPVPSLFTFNMPGNAITGLMGISVEDVKVKIATTKLDTTGPLLITHWGVSGPAILKLSAWGARDLAASNYHFTAIVNWVTPLNEATLRSQFDQLRRDSASQKIVSRNPFGLPARLWEFFIERCGIKPDMRWADLPSARQQDLIKNLTAMDCHVKGKTTYKDEFVTAGGIKLNEVEAHSMMSKRLPGLYFAGEILDVDGVTGGFNFQHAWTSGWVAANSIAQTV